MAEENNKKVVDGKNNSHIATDSKYPANPLKDRIEKLNGVSLENKKSKSVVKGEVKIAKKPFLVKVKENFIDDEADTIGDYILKDIIIPTVKDLIYNMVTGALDVSLYGSYRRGRGRSNNDPNKSYVSYSSYYNGKKDREPHADRRQKRASDQNLLFRDRRDAEDVLSRMLDYLDEYPAVTVADFYDICGKSSETEFTDNKYGWTSLKGVKIRKTRDGYIIDLPRPTLI